MISDKNIDMKTCKMYCIFGDKKFKQALNTMKKKYAELSKDKAQLQEVLDAIEEEQGSEEEQLDEGKAGRAIKKGVEELGKASEKTAKNISKGGFGKKVYKVGLKVLKGMSVKGTAKATLLGTIFAGGYTVWNGINELVSGVVDWLTGRNGKGSAAYGAGLLGVVGLGIAAYLTRDLWTQLFKKEEKKLKDVLSNGSASSKSETPIAKCTFEADGTPYELLYYLGNDGWTLTSDGEEASQEEARQLAKTNFAKKFAAKCKQCLSFIDNKPVVSAIEKMSDDSAASVVGIVKSYMPELKRSMFTMKMAS